MVQDRSKPDDTSILDWVHESGAKESRLSPVGRLEVEKQILIGMYNVYENKDFE